VSEPEEWRMSIGEEGPLLSATARVISGMLY
jgi:hypothetical protein